LFVRYFNDGKEEITWYDYIFDKGHINNIGYYKSLFARLS